jgi:hypothetical protein
MPGRDGTGPIGQGAMTGGRRGWCASGGRGVGRGGRGWRHQFYATGLTGWQRAQMSGAEPAPALAADRVELEADPVARLSSTLAEVLTRLERLEREQGR